MALPVNIEPNDAAEWVIVQGASFSRTYTLKQDGVALDLSGCTGQAQIRKTFDATDKVDITVDLTNAASGIIVLSLTDEQTQALSVGGTARKVHYGYCDLKLTEGTNVQRIFSCDVYVSRGVTR